MKTEREKIAQIVAEHLWPQGKAHKTLYGTERRCYSRDNFAEQDAQRYIRNQPYCINCTKFNTTISDN